MVTQPSLDIKIKTSKKCNTEMSHGIAFFDFSSLRLGDIFFPAR